MSWQSHLKPEERARLAEITTERIALTALHRRIYDRCRKRAKRAEN